MAETPLARLERLYDEHSYLEPCLSVKLAIRPLLRVAKAAKAFSTEQFTEPDQDDLFGWMARVRERRAELDAALAELEVDS